MRTPLVLIVRDGWGIGRDYPGNAVMLARPNVLAHLLATYPHTVLGAAGRAVGLRPGYQGSSEFGHLNMGAGRIVEQEIVRVDKLIESGDLFRHPMLLSVTEQCRAKGSALHFMGLLQDQGVRFEFFHRLDRMELSKDRRRLARIHFARQARVRGGAYQPLFTHRGLRCISAGLEPGVAGNSDQSRADSRPPRGV